VFPCLARRHGVHLPASARQESVPASNG
jgi:hypothetical protein